MLPALATDMNIGDPVVSFFRELGIDILSGREENWHSFSDSKILALAHAQNRFVLTHDSDFGKLAVLRKEPLTGIIYLRPGGQPPNLVIADLKRVIDTDIDWGPPLIVVYRSGRLRLRKIH